MASNEAGASNLDASLAKLVSFFLERSVKADTETVVSAAAQVPHDGAEVSLAVGTSFLRCRGARSGHCVRLQWHSQQFVTC